MGQAHDSSVLCDALVSVPKTALRDFIGELPPPLLLELDRALRIALHVE